MRLPLSLLLLLVFCVSGFGSDLARPIYDSELASILDECLSLRAQLQTSQDSLSKAETTLTELRLTLSERQKRIDDLLARSKSLADNLESSVETLTTLNAQLEALKLSFEQYKNAVAWEQIKTAALWAAGGVIVGFLAGVVF